MTWRIVEAWVNRVERWACPIRSHRRCMFHDPRRVGRSRAEDCAECEPRIVWLQSELARLAPGRVLEHGTPDLLAATRGILYWKDKMRLRYLEHRRLAANMPRATGPELDTLPGHEAGDDWRIRSLRERFLGLPSGKQRLLRAWFRDGATAEEVHRLGERGLLWCPGRTVSHYVELVLEEMLAGLNADVSCRDARQLWALIEEGTS